MHVETHHFPLGSRLIIATHSHHPVWLARLCASGNNVQIILLLSGISLGAGGAALLRAASRGDRWLVALGWGALAALAACFALAMGAETGLPTAIVTLPVLALAWVGASARRRPWRSQKQTEQADVSPGREEGWLRASSRWLVAGPIALLASILPIAAIAIRFGDADEDTIVLALTGIVMLWSVLAAWAFSTRSPLRTLACIMLIGTLAGALVFEGIQT
jgi:hypothetical protein